MDLGPSVVGATAAQPGLPLQPWAGSPQARRAPGREESQRHAFHLHSDGASERAENGLQPQGRKGGAAKAQGSLLGQLGMEKQGGGMAQALS